ncbi:hypothetical protein GCM10020331_075610 [Ectobacillus funiculus]
MYLRHYEGQTWAVVANFGAERASLQLPSLGQSDDVIISNYERLSADFHHLDLKTI